MSCLDVEREHLSKADKDIAEGEQRILAQAKLIARLRQDGHDTDVADLLLVNLQQTLMTWKAHRDQILAEISRLEQMPAYETL